MNPRKPTRQRLRLSPYLRLLPAVFLLVCGCHRAPPNAADLQSRLPAQFRGELHLQGETEARQIVVEAHEWSVRGEHLLEFKRVRYQFPAAGQVLAEGEAGIRGTISAPGLDIRIEEITGGEGADALRAGSFQGKLSDDLQSLEATWTTGLGQEARLKAHAVKP